VFAEGINSFFSEFIQSSALPIASGVYSWIYIHMYVYSYMFVFNDTYLYKFMFTYTCIFIYSYNYIYTVDSHDILKSAVKVKKSEKRKSAVLG
jgi:hypothetical protein